MKKSPPNWLKTTTWKTILAEEATVVVARDFLRSWLHLGHVSLGKKEKYTKKTLLLFLLFLIILKPTMNIYKMWTFILKSLRGH